MDLVYVLGSGSQWNNNELRFSLRSVEKNLKGVGKIYIIGENPGFLTKKVIHIYQADPLKNNADGNMAMKIIRACQETKLTKNFLFMNDDFIIHKPMDIKKIEWMHKGDFKNRPEEYWTAQFYRYRLRRTYDLLLALGLPTMQYDYHAPMIFNKELFPMLMEQFDYKADIGYTFRSLYGNYYRLPANRVNGRKVTIYKYYSLEQLRKRVKDALFVGYNDQGLNRSLKYWLIDNFPEKSKFEVDEVDDKITRLYLWQKNGMDFDEGVRIFEKYYHHVNLLRLFKMGETQTLRKKLEYRLTRTMKEL